MSHVASLIGSSVKHQKIGLSEERLEPLKKYIRDYISYWREYPDMFVDFLQTGGRDDIEPGIKFYFYQRVFLRVAIRYKYVYMVFPRAYENAPKRIYFRGQTSLTAGTLFSNIMERIRK